MSAILDIKQAQLITEFYKEITSDPTIKNKPSIFKVVEAYDYIVKHTTFQELSSKVDPVNKWLIGKPELCWFISKENISKFTTPLSKELQARQPSLNYDQILTQVLHAWYASLIDFTTKHGYQSLSTN
jgi:hypothetical protein